MLSEHGYAETIGGDYAWVTCNGLPTVDFAGSGAVYLAGTGVERTEAGSWKVWREIELTSQSPSRFKVTGLNPTNFVEAAEGMKFYLYDRFSSGYLRRMVLR